MGYVPKNSVPSQHSRQSNNYKTEQPFLIRRLGCLNVEKWANNCKRDRADRIVFHTLHTCRFLQLIRRIEDKRDWGRDLLFIHTTPDVKEWCSMLRLGTAGRLMNSNRFRSPRFTIVSTGSVKPMCVLNILLSKFLMTCCLHLSTIMTVMLCLISYHDLIVPAGSPSRGGDVAVYVFVINQPSLPTICTLFLYLFLSLWPFQQNFIA